MLIKEKDVCYGLDTNVQYSYSYQLTPANQLRINNIFNHTDGAICVEFPEVEKAEGMDYIFGQIAIEDGAFVNHNGILPLLKIPANASVAMSSKTLDSVHIDRPDSVGAFLMQQFSNNSLSSSWMLFADRKTLKELLGEMLEAPISESESVVAHEIDIHDVVDDPDAEICCE